MPRMRIPAQEPWAPGKRGSEHQDQGAIKLSDMPPWLIVLHHCCPPEESWGIGDPEEGDPRTCDLLRGGLPPFPPTRSLSGTNKALIPEFLLLSTGLEPPALQRLCPPAR